MPAPNAPPPEAAIPRRRISAILRALAASERPTTFGEMSTAFDGRVFGAFLILLGAFNLIPFPPGASLVAGVPLFMVSVQMTAGRRTLWLPARMTSLPISAATLTSVMRRLGPPLRRIERLARHRLWPASDVLLARSVGAFTLLLWIPVILPIPLSNVLPGIGIALLGIGLTARDGVWLTAGFLAGIAALIALTVIYGAAIMAVLRFI
ncbi:ABC transporter permease [Aureimonas sp. SA4125]|uniref:exopolysaccharide biosynthesis protein n=1 Tax=Aureimonas sp. SA4125 TaxID=2826993 RepID=UPI001CC43CE5|nr:exopolysaccharide biosynthesis protein [Aureimonas sp. SA4125]BDA85334.1 ABC transporter permease [Aureimonas sp. SA4125]